MHARRTSDVCSHCDLTVSSPSIDEAEENEGGSEGNGGGDGDGPASGGVMKLGAAYNVFDGEELLCMAPHFLLPPLLLHQG